VPVNGIARRSKRKFGEGDNPLKMAPHTLAVITTDDWKHAYTRKQAAFPLPYLYENKFWPSTSRVNNTLGDRNLICTCEPLESYQQADAAGIPLERAKESVDSTF